MGRTIAAALKPTQKPVNTGVLKAFQVLNQMHEEKKHAPIIVGNDLSISLAGDAK